MKFIGNTTQERAGRGVNPTTRKRFIFLATITLFLALGVSGCQSVSHSGFGEMAYHNIGTSYGYKVVEDPTKLGPSKLVERFEVRPGDCTISQWYDDCANDRERAEIQQKDKDIWIDSTEWYGWNLYVPKNHINVYPTKLALGQFFQVGAGPAWMFQNSAGGLWLTNIMTSKYFQLIDKSNFLGRWHKIEVHANWTQGKDGFFRVYVNGELKVDFVGETASANRLYFKYGVYRSFMSRYKRYKKAEKVPGQIAYYANVKRGKTRERIQ